MRKATASMPGSGAMKLPYNGKLNPAQQLNPHQSSINKPGNKTGEAPSAGDSRKPLNTSESQATIKNKNTKSLQEFNADEE